MTFLGDRRVLHYVFFVYAIVVFGVFSFVFAVVSSSSFVVSFFAVCVCISFSVVAPFADVFVV